MVSRISLAIRAFHTLTGTTDQNGNGLAIVCDCVGHLTSATDMAVDATPGCLPLPDFRGRRRFRGRLERLPISDARTGPFGLFTSTTRESNRHPCQMTDALGLVEKINRMSSDGK